MDADAKKLIETIAAALQVPVDKRVWTDAQVAEYLGISVSNFQNRIIHRPDFTPVPFRVGSSRRWWAREVIQYAEAKWREAKYERDVMTT